MQTFIYCKVTLHVSGVTAPIIRSTKTVTATAGIGHNTGTATSFQRGLLRTGVSEYRVAMTFSPVVVRPGRETDGSLATNSS